MRVGVVVAQGFDLHFREIQDVLAAEHELTRFRARQVSFQIASERINRFLLDRDLARLMRDSDVMFFEWAEHEFVRGTHLPKTTPIVVRLHLHELWDFAPQARLPVVDRVILVSHAMERKFVAQFPEMTGRTVTIHNGVRLDRFRPNRREFDGVIGVLARIDPHKRLYDLVLAIHALRRQGHDVSLRIGGTCTEARYERYAYEVAHLVERLDISSHVRFDGQVADPASWLRGIDVFVSNSCSEGLQVALIEAMATGCWCLSHRWDGAEEALPPDHLFLGEDELISKIAAICAASPAARQAAAVAMRERAERNFDIERQRMTVKSVVEAAVTGA